MANFSSFLEEYLSSHKLTIKDFSTICNIPLLDSKNFVYGKALPENINVIQKIYRNLNMSFSEKSKLIRYFIEETNSSYTADFHNYMDELFFSFSYFSKSPTSAFPKLCCKAVPEIPEKYLMLSDQKELQDAINYALEYNLHNTNNNTVYVYMQPSIFLNNLILRHSSIFDFSYKQIVCLDNSPKQPNLENLSIFSILLPLVYSEIDTDISYYYEDLSLHHTSVAILPFFLCIGDMVIFTDKELSEGYYINNKAYSEHIRNMFFSIKYVTNKFFTPITKNQVLENMAKTTPYDDIFILFGSPLNSFFTKFEASIHYIITKNTLDAIPQFNKKTILSNLLCSLKNNRNEIFLINEANNISNDCGIIIFNNKLYLFYQTKTNGNIDYNITEFFDPGIARCFIDYFYYIIETSNTLSGNELITYIEKILKQQ